MPVPDAKLNALVTLVKVVRERGYAKQGTIQNFLAAGYQKEQVMNPRGPRFLLQLYSNKHHHSIHAGWLGCVGGRVSSHDRARCFPYEGSGSLCRILLSFERGCCQSLSCD